MDLLMKKIFTAAVVLAWCAGGAWAARIKDIAYLEGARETQVVGYGLVVGLSGTGDKADPSTQKAISNMLSRFGISVSAGELKSRNVASVLVMAGLPAFPQPGQKVDVSVSSLGDASSLEGGTLVRTPLYGPDGAMAAVGQGTLSGGKKRSAGRIAGGAEVEMSPVRVFEKDGVARLLLNRPDFQTAREIERAVREKFGEGSASAQDASAVKINVPADFRTDVVGFIARVGGLEVNPDLPARVVINSVTGAVVIGGQARLLPCAVSAGGMEISVEDGQGSLQPPAAGEALTASQGENLEGMVKALNALGANPRQLVEVIKTLHSAGVFTGELEII